jgi:hypothetical protein
MKVSGLDSTSWRREVTLGAGGIGEGMAALADDWLWRAIKSPKGTVGLYYDNLYFIL